MRCPFCREDIRIQGRFCPKCGRQIFGLPAQRPGAGPSVPTPAAPSQAAQPPLPQPSTPAAPPGLVDLDIGLDDGFATEAEPATPESAAAEYIGKTCPYCRFPIKPGEDIVVCPACKVPHHEDCWRENGGCTTYGCTGVVASAPRPAINTGTPAWRPQQPAPEPDPLPPDIEQRVEATFLEMRARELNARATSALVLAFLGILCFLPAIIAFFMGVGILGQLAHVPSLGSQPAKGRAIAAIVVAPLTAALNILFINSIGAQ